MGKAYIHTRSESMSAKSETYKRETDTDRQYGSWDVMIY